MSVHSYFELATTLVGWHIANGIAEILVASGLIFVPFGVALYNNWAGPIRSQESKSAAPVSLRRMEQDICIAAVVIIFCFLPSIPIDPSDIEFQDTQNQNRVTAGDPDIPYMRETRKVEEIRVPILWWFVYQVSSILTNAVNQVVLLLGEPGMLRPALLRIAQVSINSESLISEMREFRQDCYEPSLAKYQNSDNPPKPTNLYESVDWLGSRIFLDTPGFYKKCEQVSLCGTGYHANSHRVSWRAASKTQLFQPGKPFCDAWWSHPSIGLRLKLLEELYVQAPWLKDDLETIRRKHEKKNENSQRYRVSDYEDRLLRRLINKAPPVMVNRADNGKSINWLSTKIFSVDGIQQIIGSLGALTASAVLHVIMELMIIGLPMTQSVMLMLLYISIPLVVPYAIVNPSIIVRMVVILFSLRFLSALWAVAAFLDEKLLETMYPDSGMLEFGGSGTIEDVVLGLITLISYISLPIAWFLLVGSISSTAIRSLAHGWSSMNQTIESATATGIQDLRKTASSRKI